MLFGLTNAPATFQHLMESCLGELHLNWCIIYLDDIIIHSRTPEEHIVRLRGVFERLRTAGLKLKPSKCTFFKDQIAYLGHIVSKQGIEVNPKKVEVIRKWPKPRTVTDVQSQESFEQLQELSLGSLVLAYAYYKKPFKVYTDASEKGLGAVLAQRQEDGSEPAIAFASRTLPKAEK